MQVEPGNFDLTPEVHAQLVKNLTKRAKQFSPQSITAGKDWYVGGYEDSSYIGEQSGGSVLSGAAILGKLSAGTEWGKNRMMGLQLLGMSDRHANFIRRAHEIAKENDGKEAATALRRRAGLPGTPLDLQSSMNIDSALRVRNKEYADPMDAFTIKPTGANKTPDFTMGLATAGQHHVPAIDTHAYDAAMDSYHITYGVANKHLAKKGVYNFMQNVYADAHKVALKHKLIPEGTTLPEFQAMHWVHHINNKVEVNAGAARTAKANVTQNANLLRNNPTLDPTVHGLRPLVTREVASPISSNDHFSMGSAEGRG